MLCETERVRRRPGFLEGVDVRLSDGGTWTLPPLSSARDNPAQNALLRAIYEAEDRAEGRRAELALTIFLLRRNYEVAPEQLLSLLSFAPDDPALAALQQSVHDLVLASPPPQASTEPPATTGRVNRAVGSIARLSARFSSTWAHGAH